MEELAKRKEMEEKFEDALEIIEKMKEEDDKLRMECQKKRNDKRLKAIIIVPMPVVETHSFGQTKMTIQPVRTIHLFYNQQG